MNEIIIGGVAAMGACIFTNPLEVLKVRMQLQGELEARGQHVIHYKNVVHAAFVIAKNDGILSLQKGLVPALYVQFVMNGLRLGLFHMAEVKGYTTAKNGDIVIYRTALVGGTVGMIGQFCSSPLSMVKTHLQNEAVFEIAVGHQHHHEGMSSALLKLYKNYGVYKGLFRGGYATIPRGFIASMSQLTSFQYAKHHLQQYEYFQDKPILKTFLGSMVGGVAISVMVTPFDLVLTRLYNQPVSADGEGMLYKNYIDCVMKIYQTEGLLAFYKGLGAVYFRLGPHSMLVLGFWDRLKHLYDLYVIK